MLNPLLAAATPGKTPRFNPRRGKQQEERLYKQVNRRVSLR
jgi:hypothetical protein